MSLFPKQTFGPCIWRLDRAYEFKLFIIIIFFFPQKLLNIDYSTTLNVMYHLKRVRMLVVMLACIWPCYLANFKSAYSTPRLFYFFRKWEICARGLENSFIYCPVDFLPCLTLQCRRFPTALVRFSLVLQYVLRQSQFFNWDFDMVAWMNYFPMKECLKVSYCSDTVAICQTMILFIRF